MGSGLSPCRRREGASFLNAARTTLGLPTLVAPPHEQVARADRVLVMGTPTFEFPLRRPLPANVRYIGTILDANPSASWEPALDGEQPWVLVSLSTLPQGQGPVMRNVLEAIARLPITPR